MADAGHVELLTGWGRTAPTAALVIAPEDDADVDALLARSGRRGLIARGLGRSYGDAAQNAGGTVLDATALAGRGSTGIRIEPDTGVARIAAGVSIDALIRAALPLGYFV